MNIAYLIKYLWKRKWLILIPSILAVVLAWWFSRNQDAEFTSVAELSTGYMDVNPLSNNTRNRNNKVLFNNVLQTLRSNQVLDQVSYGLLLHDLQGSTPFIDEDTAKSDGIVAQYPGGKNGLLVSLSNKADSFYVLNLARKEDRIIRELADYYGYAPDNLLGMVQMSRIEGSDFIKITATTNDPGLSAFIANEICQRFLALYQSRLGLASNTSMDSLRSLMETKKQILHNKLQLLQSDGDEALSGSVGMLSTLRGRLSQQNSDLIAAQVALENVNKQIDASSEEGGVQSGNGDVITLRTRIDDLYAKYVNAGSEDTSLLNEIDRLRSELQQKLSTMGGSSTGGGIPVSELKKQKMNLEIRIAVARQTMKDLQEKIDKLKGEVQSSAARHSVVQGIQSEIEIARRQFEDANRLYNEALTQNMFPGNNFQQVLQASPPLHPNPSKKIKIIGFAGAGVFFFIVFLLLFFEFVDPSIKTPSYLKANLPFPLLANLKFINSREVPVEKMFDPEESLNNSHKGFKEQIKQLRYEVQNSGKKLLLIGGQHAESGRTTLIESLAGSLALSKNKVLMVDANFQNNTLTRKYDAKPSVESFKPKGDQNEINKAISTLVVKGYQENIKIIGCESGGYTPREILPEKNIFSALKKNENYDYVLIDCVSLSQGPDFKELLRYADGVIVNFAANQTLTEEDKELINFLKINNIKTLGTVLNKIPEYSMNL